MHDSGRITYPTFVDGWIASMSASARARARDYIARIQASSGTGTVLKYRRALVVIAQLALVVISNYLAFSLRFDGNLPAAEYRRFLTLLPWLVAFRGLAFVPFRVYEGLWKYTSLTDLMNIFAAVFLSSVGCAALVTLPTFTGYPRSVIVIDSLLLLVMLLILRVSRRMRDRLNHSAGKRVLIFGAGDAGAAIVRDMQDHDYGYEPIGFVDDNPAKVGKYIHGVKVLGRRSDLARLMASERPEEVLIAMPSRDRSTVRAVAQLLEPFKVPIKTLPGLQDLLDGRVGVNQIRALTVEDLLARSPVELSIESVRALLRGQRVMVTGAGGSIGSELARQVAALEPESLIVFERYENALHDLVQDLSERCDPDVVKPVIGDITDGARVRETMGRYRPQIVFHAAAHKHVPLMEQNPCEAVKNNVHGTLTLARAAIDARVERFILISTDKAVNPSSVMGATKRIAECALRKLSGDPHRTRFAAVRFGNVLGSNGSVLPRFIEQIKAGGPLTVTHPDMRRYFMLIPEAVQLVLHAATLGEPGMTYVLEMGEQIKLVNLARHVIRLAGYVPDKEIAIRFIGLRPGEKLSEELVDATEIAEPSPIPKILRVKDVSMADRLDLEADIDSLIDAAMAGNTTAVLQRMRWIVPSLETREPFETSKTLGLSESGADPLLTIERSPLAT
jgi:FlaA1/EpsC-like NDP-sugar epimerase